MTDKPAERNSTIRAVMLITSSTYVTYALGLVVGAIIARSLGPSLYGRYAFLVWLSGWLVVVVNNGLNTSGIRFLSEHLGRDARDTAQDIHGWLLRRHYISLTLGVVLFVIVASFIRPEDWAGQMTLFISVAVVSVISRSKYLFDTSVAKGYGAFHVEAHSTFIVSAINAVFVCALAYLHASLAAYLVVFAASSAGLWIYAEMALRRASIRPAPRPLAADLQKEINAHLMWTIVLVGFVSFGTRTIETFFLNTVSGPAEVGFFAIANTLTRGGIDLLTVGLSTVLMPMMGRAFGEGGRERVHAIFSEALRFFVFFGLLLAGLGTLWAKLAISTLYGAPYAPVIPVLQVMTVVGGLTLGEAALGSLLATTGNQKRWAQASAVQLILSALFSSLLIPTYGLNGAVASLSISRVLTVSFLAATTVRQQGIKLPKGALARLALSAVVAFAVALAIIELIPGIPGEAVAGILYVASFFGATILFKAWSHSQVDLLANALARRARFASLRSGIEIWRDRYTS